MEYNYINSSIKVFHLYKVFYIWVIPSAPCNASNLTQGKNFLLNTFVGVAYQRKDIVFRFIIEGSSLKDFCP